MEELDLSQLEPVSDPTIIAQLEQPQSAINKDDGATQGAYSQVAMDAFDRAIASAGRLKAHAGFGAAVGSGFDPQSWGSWNPFGGSSIGKDGEEIAQKPLAGTAARDFVAELGAMRAQVFLPMVQSLKGMGALSNAEGQKLTDAIGALDPGMSEDAFRSSLDRIIGDLTTYRNRGDPTKMGQQQDQAAVAPAPAGPGDIGFSGAVPPPSNPLNPEQQTAYDLFWKTNPQATADQLRSFGASIGVNIDNADQIIEARDKGAGVQGGAEAVPGLTPEEQAEVAGRVSDASGFDRASAGMADTVTMGTANKIIAAGRDLAGKGEYDRELLKANAVTDQIADESPWLYHGGQVAGGLVLPMFEARTPAQLAKVGAAYGALYGAGSSDSLAEVPANTITGGTIGAATAWGGGKLVQKLEQRAARKAAEVGTDAAKESGETAADRYARGQKFGMDLSIGDVRGMGAKATERLLDVQPGSAGVMNKTRDKLSGQIDEAVDDVAGTFGPSTSFRGMGEAAQRGAKSWISKFEDLSRKAYDAVPIVPKAQATVANTRQALSELTSIFQSNSKLADAFKNMKLNRYMEALDPDAGGKLSWNDLKAFRSRIGEEIGDQRFSDSPTKAELRRLYGALSEDMRATALEQGPKALKAFERANTLYRQGQQRIDGAITKILGDDAMKSPEAAAARIQSLVREGKSSADLNMVHEVWKSLPAQERGEVANGLIRLMGQPANSEGRAFNAQTFMRNFNDMAPEAKNLLFGAEGKELRQNLDEFSKVIGDVAANNSTRNTSNTAMGLAGGAGLFAGGLPGLITQTATSYGAARLWTNPKFVRWATGFTKMMKGAEKAGAEPSEAGVKTQMRLLDKIIATEPTIASEATGLRQAILKVANDNLGSQAAASEEEKKKAGQR